MKLNIRKPAGKLYAVAGAVILVAVIAVIWINVGAGSRDAAGKTINKASEEPVQETNQKVPGTNQPVQKTEEPVQEANQPIQENEQPVQVVSQPVQETNQTGIHNQEGKQPLDENSSGNPAAQVPNKAPSDPPVEGADLTTPPKPQIITVQIPSAAKIQAQNWFPSHFYDVFTHPVEYGFANEEEVSQLVLGTPFNVFKYADDQVSDTGIYYFPVLLNGKVKATLGLVQASDGSYSGTFSVGFAAELEATLGKVKEPIKIFTLDGEIRAITAKEDYIVVGMPGQEAPKPLTESEVEKINALDASNVTAKKYTEETISVQPLNLSQNEVLSRLFN